MDRVAFDEGVVERARKCLLSNELCYKVTQRPRRSVGEEECANNIGIMVFDANPFVSRGTPLVAVLRVSIPAKLPSHIAYRGTVNRGATICRGHSLCWGSIFLALMPRTGCP